MTSLRPSRLDFFIKKLLTWERKRLMEAVKVKDECKALQLRKNIRRLKRLLAMRRSFMEKQEVDEACMRSFLMKQRDCLSSLKEELKEFERRLGTSNHGSNDSSVDEILKRMEALMICF